MVEDGNDASNPVRSISLMKDSIDALFSQAVEQYIDENKPDPLVRKQMRAWSFQWKEEQQNEGNTKTNQRLRQFRTIEDLPFIPTHCIVGELTWKSEYLQVHLQSECYWKGSKKGSLFFACHATASRAALSVSSEEGESVLGEETKVNKKERKAREKVHTRMVKRLENDDYVRQIMKKKDKQQPSSSSKQESEQQGPPERGAVLCEASIIATDEQHLEERVRSSQKIGEAVRRAVFSTANDALDVFDFVLRLPFLPCTRTANCPANTDTAAGAFATTNLADRAKLRLLEDATYDACEEEGEEEMVNDLRISLGSGNLACKTATSSATKGNSSKRSKH